MILHLHSGHHRKNDLQHCYEHKIPPDDMSTYVLSRNVANAITGNLTNWTTVLCWRDQMAKGRVAAIIAGPPFETWSAARTRPIEGMKHPPRPLRNHTMPWGLRYFSQEEYDQHMRLVSFTCWSVVGGSELVVVRVHASKFGPVGQPEWLRGMPGEFAVTSLLCMICDGHVSSFP